MSSFIRSTKLSIGDQKSWLYTYFLTKIAKMSLKVDKIGDGTIQ